MSYYAYSNTSNGQTLLGCFSNSNKSSGFGCLDDCGSLTASKDLCLLTANIIIMHVLKGLQMHATYKFTITLLCVKAAQVIDSLIACILFLNQPHTAACLYQPTNSSLLLLNHCAITIAMHARAVQVTDMANIACVFLNQPLIAVCY